jgi:uncharacterized protein YlbG (UPF0298 family)
LVPAAQMRSKKASYIKTYLHESIIKTTLNNLSRVHKHVESERNEFLDTFQAVPNLEAEREEQFRVLS